ncbi:hypothetical protein DPMN_184558 [Dreissena polymorpha]|uniref:Uncharacterized protein n=1 Tax=Dreissena polymorpha TaxID=45954 RepID=A0A9D4I804_DREPO|nr:hypothetical protein DPMN_184558 [Dreissena polymorpha]
MDGKAVSTVPEASVGVGTELVSLLHRIKFLPRRRKLRKRFKQRDQFDDLQMASTPQEVPGVPVDSDVHGA